jgi:DNA-binding CsgD family transcriptional regulator
VQRQFGLTPAQAAFTRELVHGDEVNATAERIGIAAATARVQLRSVLAKTSTDRRIAECRTRTTG